MITGGSFENGAKTAAYGYLFNQMSQVWKAAFSGGVNGNGEKNYLELQQKGLNGLNTLAEGVKTGISACGVVNPGCRTADGIIGGVELVANVANENWSETGASVAGKAVGFAVESALPKTTFTQSVRESVGYIYDKTTEAVIKWVTK
jgi:hypothetical protein